MQATIVDLRYRMKQVLAALARGEEVAVVYHREKIAMIVPLRKKSKKAVLEHPFFGMLKNDEESVGRQMDKLRGGRYRDI